MKRVEPDEDWSCTMPGIWDFASALTGKPVVLGYYFSNGEGSHNALNHSGALPNPIISAQTLEKKEIPANTGTKRSIKFPPLSIESAAFSNAVKSGVLSTVTAETTHTILKMLSPPFLLNTDSPND